MFKTITNWRETRTRVKAIPFIIELLDYAVTFVQKMHPLGIYNIFKIVYLLMSTASVNHFSMLTQIRHGPKKRSTSSLDMWVMFRMWSTILGERAFTRAGKFLYRYQECIDPGPESNILMDHFLCFLHFDPVLLNFLWSFYLHFMK